MGSSPSRLEPLTGTARSVRRGRHAGRGNGGLTQPAYDAAALTIAGNGINEVFEKNFDIGGPLVKDNLWFWFGFTQNDINVALITGQADVTKLRNTSAKIHGQFLGKGTYRGFYTVGDKIKTGRGGGVDRPPETTWNQTTGDLRRRRGYFITPDFEISAQVSTVQGGFQFQPQGDFNQQIFRTRADLPPHVLRVPDRSPGGPVHGQGRWFFDTGPGPRAEVRLRQDRHGRLVQQVRRVD
jgi:hypothetical protein